VASWFVLPLGFAVVGGPFLAVPSRLVPEGASARLAQVTAAASVLLVAAVIAAIAAAPHQLAGGDTCPVLSDHALRLMGIAELIALGIAPIAVGMSIRGRRRLGGFPGLAVYALFTVGACAAGLFALVVVGVCGS
jgi:hypothetical protein